MMFFEMNQLVARWDGKSLGNFFLLLLMLLSLINHIDSSTFAETLVEIIERLQHIDKSLIQEDICIVTSNYQPDLRWTDTVTEFARGAAHRFTPIAYTNLQTFPALSRRCSFYLIQLDFNDSYKFAQEATTKLPYQDGWNRYAKFIFVSFYVAENKNTSAVWKSYSYMVMYLGVLNSILILRKEATNHTTIFSVNYFRRSARMLLEGIKNVIAVLSDNHFDDVGGISFNVIAELYPSLLFYKDGKMEGATYAMVETFCKKVNASCTWEDISDIQKRIELVSKNKFSMILHVLVSCRHLEPVIYPLHDGFCLLIPERKIAYSHHLMKPFDLNLWIGLLLFCGVCVNLNVWLQRVYPQNILEIVLFGSPFAEHQMRFIERVTFCVSSILLLILCESYIAKMFAFMATNKYEPHYESVDEFLRSGNPLLMHNNSVKFWLEWRPALIEPAVVDDDSPPIDDSRYLKFARILHCIKAKTFIGSPRNYDIDRNQYKYYRLEEQLLDDHYTNLISKLDPFGVKFQEIHNRLIECGLWGFWYRSSLSMYQMKEMLECKYLSFEDVIWLWLILFYGFTASTVVFFGELIVSLV